MDDAKSLPPNKFKRHLIEGKVQIGLWLSMDSLFATEIVAGSGFDWLLLDMEHTSIDLSQVVQHLRAAKGGTAEVVVRIPWNEPIIVKRLLDAGVRSLMVPYVQSAEEARRAVAATRYPPQGVRGSAGNTRASNFNRLAAYLEKYQEEQCLIAQIETPASIEAIEEIGKVDGVDGLFVGPNDLAMNMGRSGDPGAADVKLAIADALARIRATGKAAGILNFNPGEARAHIAANIGFIAVGSDASILARKSEALLAEVR